jgi:hypothetical protein
MVRPMVSIRLIFLLFLSDFKRLLSGQPADAPATHPISGRFR